MLNYVFLVRLVYTYMCDGSVFKILFWNGSSSILGVMDFSVYRNALGEYHDALRKRLMSVILSGDSRRANQW